MAARLSSKTVTLISWSLSDSPCPIKTCAPRGVYGGSARTHSMGEGEAEECGGGEGSTGRRGHLDLVRDREAGRHGYAVRPGVITPGQPGGPSVGSFH